MKSLAIMCVTLSAAVVVGCGEDSPEMDAVPSGTEKIVAANVGKPKTGGDVGKQKASSQRTVDPCDKYLKGRSCVTNYPDEEMKLYRTVVESFLRKCRDSGLSPDAFESAINSTLQSVATSLTMLKGMPNEKELIIQTRSQLPE